jgi:hypothetical protein
MFFPVWVVFHPSGGFACLSGLAQFLIPGYYEVRHIIILSVSHNVKHLSDGGRSSLSDAAGRTSNAQTSSRGLQHTCNPHGPRRGQARVPRTCPEWGPSLGYLRYNVSLRPLYSHVATCVSCRQ